MKIQMNSWYGSVKKLRMKKGKYTALEHEIRSEVKSMQKLNRI